MPRIGLLLGGVLTQALSWHWIFFVNLPIGAVTAFAATRLVERDEGIGLKQGADALGAVLITAALMLGVYTIVKPAADDGWGAPLTLGLGAASLALLAAFIAREATARTPLVPLRIFRNRNVSGANAIQALFVAGMFGMFFLGSLYMERVLGYDPLEIGLAFLPVALAIGILSRGILGAARDALRRQADAARRTGADRRGPGPVRALAGPLELPGRPARADAPARRRGGSLVPVADGPGDVERDRSRTPGWPRAWSTPRSRSAARWAWRSWRPSPRPAPTTCWRAAPRPTPP